MGEKTMFDFAVALNLLKEGKNVARSGWNGKGMFVTLQTPTETSKMTAPYLFMTCPVGSTSQFANDEAGKNFEEKKVPWLCSQTDLLAEDWFEVVTQ